MFDREIFRLGVAKALNCYIIISEFEIQSVYYVYFRINNFGKGMNPLISLAMG